MQAHLSPSPKLRFYGTDGKPLSGGYLITYDYTTSRTCSTWADADMTTRNPFQIQLDANGEPSQNGNPVYVFLEEGRRYKFRLFDSEMNPVGCVQPVQTASVNYGDNNVFNYYASVDGTEHEITVTSSIDPETGVQTFFIGLDDDFKERVSDIEDALDDKKDRQTSLTFTCSATRTVKKITQDADGEMNVEFQDIDLPQETPNVDIVSPNDTIDIQESTDPQTNTKTFKIDVKQSGVPYAISRGSITFTPGGHYTDGTIRLTDIKSSEIEYAYNKDGWVLKKDHVYVITYNIVATTQGPSNALIGGRIWLDGFIESDQVWKFVLDSSYVHDESLVGTAIVCNDQDGEVHLNMRYDDRNLSSIPLAYINKVEIADITSIVGQGGGSGTTYTEGDGIKIENGAINVNYGSGLEVDPQTNKLKVKIGNGLKFNEESLEVEIDSDVEDVVEAVEKLTDDLDKKITTTYPFAQITSMGDFATYGVANTTRMIGQLFAVPIASEIRKDETVLCVNALQNFSGNVSFGIFEYDFEGNGGTGSTYWVADTGKVSVRAGENEFPLKYVLNDAHELQSSKLYYAVIAIAANAPASGLLLGASAAYAQNVNANPKYTLIVSNMDNYIDWSVGTLQGAWFQGYNEEYDIPRIFMMLRNSEGAAPIPVTEPFTDIGAFTLQHQYRVSDVFSLTPDANGGVYRKVIPAQDVDIVSFRYVDYHGSVNTQSSSPVLLDDTYTPLKAIGDGSWTLGDSDQTKIDGTHFVHEFTFATSVHLTANTPYWFMVGGNLSNQANDWLITYQTPSVSNDLLLVKNMYNVNSWIIPNSGEFLSSQPGMYLRLSDGTDSWTV